MFKKIMFLLILFVTPLFMPAFSANAASASARNCYSLTLGLVDGSASTIVYSNGTNWYSDSSCSTTTTPTVPLRANDKAIPVFFRTTCSQRATDHSTSGTVNYPTDGTLAITCAYTTRDGASCNISPSAITANTGYCADTFALSTNLTSIVANEKTSSATLTYSYAIRLNANGGTNGSPTTLYKKIGSTTLGSTTWYSNSDCTTAITKLTSVASKSGYTFNGYYTASTGGTQCIDASGVLSTSTSCNFTAATTLYAQYTATSSVGTCYAVTLDTDDGETSKTTKLYKKSGSTTWYSNSTCTSSITSTTVIPTKTGYKFQGYYTASTGGTQCINASGVLSTSTSCNITAATTLYAQYTANCNKITLNANGGTAASTSLLYKKSDSTTWYTDSDCKTVYTGSTNVVPRRTGYTFRGYYSESLSDVSANADNGTQYIQSNGKITLGVWQPTTDTTIYAAWAKNCTVPTNGTCTLTVASTGAVTYTTTCDNGYTLGNESTATPTCTSEYWNGGGSGSCGDVVHINFWGLNAAGRFINLTTLVQPTFTNSTGQWKTSGGTVVTDFKSLGVSIPSITSSITVGGTTYTKGIKPYRAQWVGGEPTSVPDGIIATSSVCSSNMNTTRDIALDGSLPNITSAIQNYATDAHYVILYAAECIDPTGATLGSTCSLDVSGGGATYKNTCLTGTGNPNFWNETEFCQSYAVHEMQQGQCEL